MSGHAHSQDALEQVGRSFKAAMAAMRRLRGRETHRAGELSYASYGLLFGLADVSELSSRELATAAELSPATVTQMLDSLEKAGFVARARSERDKRVVLVSLTERGRALIAERREHFGARWRAALSDFSDEQLLTAAAVLDRLGAMLDELAEDPGAMAGKALGSEVPVRATVA
jgi:DNA-binding MarR family transcriptional regulator